MMCNNPNEKLSKAEYLILQINITNAKKLALLIVIGFSIFHWILHYDNNSCESLLSRGRYKGDREWQPFGCMLHKYSTRDTRMCMRYITFLRNQNHFIFIGDSRLYLLYDAFVKQITTVDREEIAVSQFATPINNSEFIDDKLNLFVKYIYADSINQTLIDQLGSLQKMGSQAQRTTIILSLTHPNFLKGNITERVLKDYSRNLTLLVSPIDALVSKKLTVLWKLQDFIKEDEEITAWKNVKNQDIRHYNDEAEKILKHSLVKIWSSSAIISSGLIEQSISSWIPSPLVLNHDSQILLNMHCNDYMNFNDGSCCSSTESYTSLQLVTFCVLGLCVATSFCLLIQKWFSKIRGQTMYVRITEEINMDPTYELETEVENSVRGTSICDVSNPVCSLAILAIIMAYFYVCDRTNFFMKENKYYSEFSFWIPVGYVFILGIFFNEESHKTSILHKDQVDELKGWMQLIIIIYNLTGAERILPIYMHVKLLFSTYLFLCGYSHFRYLWNTGNFGIVKFFQDIFRLNFITVVLCLCMNRPYQFYYFVPLLSFWYTIVFVLLAIPKRISASNMENNPFQQYLYFIGKIIGALILITILYMSEVLFERIFVTRPWKALFVSVDDDIHEWWKIWKLDRFTIFFGVIFSALVHLAQKYSFIDESTNGNLFSKRTTVIFSFFAIGGITFYTLFSFLCSNRKECEEIHSYIVFIPIIGYLLIRNIIGQVRSKYSSFFAWFGKISLELFICQYHIWLAADKNGVLVLIPGHPTRNLVVTTFIFICISHEIHRLTQVLLPYVVPNDWKLCLRNLGLFLIVLIPVGIYDGML